MKINNKYGTDIEKLITQGQMLCQEEALVNKVNKIVQDELYRYGDNGVNLVFTDVSLGKQIQQRHSYISVTTIPFYFSQSNSFDYDEMILDKDAKALINHLNNSYDKDKNRVNIVIMNPPFAGTMHLKMFNMIKNTRATRIYCVHPCTQLEALPTYKNGKCSEFNEYLSDGVASQEFLPFDSFVNTKSFGDIVIDEYDNEDKSRNKPIKPNPWALRKDCNNKELYSVIFNRLMDKLQTTKSIKQSIIPFGRNTDKLGYNYFLNVADIKNGIGNCSNSQLVSDCHKEPYDQDGFTQNTNNLIPDKKHISENYWGGNSVEGMKCWNNGSYRVLGFNTIDDALYFYNTWSTPIAKLIINCVSHDQHIKQQLIPYYSGDLLSWLGLDPLKQEIQDEADWLDAYRYSRQKNGK